VQFNAYQSYFKPVFSSPGSSWLDSVDFSDARNVVLQPGTIKHS